MNILLTCGGARTFLLDVLKAAAGGRVLACDASPDAPALHHADRGFVVPDVTEPAYLGALRELCRREEVDLLIPSMEHELPLLAAHRAEFAAAGTLVLVSTPHVVEICGDKLKAAGFLAEQGVLVPKTWVSLEDARDAIDRGELAFPVVVKPRWGVSSIGLSFPEDEHELELSWAVTRRVIDRSPALAAGSAADPTRSVLIQELVAGTQYGFDVVNDLRGRYAATLVRRKLRMRAGQTDRAETVAHEAIEAIGERIGRALGHIGVLDCDVIANASGCCVLDMNPRLGGGYPFSHLAGANVPAALVAWARGEDAQPAWLRAAPLVRTLRYDGFLAVHDPVPPPAADSIRALHHAFTER